MGLVFQYSALFDSLNVYDNVAFGLREQRRLPAAEISQIVAEKLALVGLPDAGDQMPDELSGGMRKRVGIARALAMEPEIMLYDEPTSGLDPIMAGTIDGLIRRLRDQLQVTSLLVSHDVASLLALADRVAMLHGGEFIALGSPDQLRESSHALVRQFIERRPE